MYNLSLRYICQIEKKNEKKTRLHFFFDNTRTERLQGWVAWRRVGKRRKTRTNPTLTLSVKGQRETNTTALAQTAEWVIHKRLSDHRIERLYVRPQINPSSHLLFSFSPIVFCAPQRSVLYASHTKLPVPHNGLFCMQQSHKAFRATQWSVLHSTVTQSFPCHPMVCIAFNGHTKL